ncbi:MAG: YggT family protein [Alphaproteobacteria bacterium]
MEPTSPYSAVYWLFHIPNYLLSAVIYSLLGRFLLGFILPVNSANYIYRWFVLLTEPFVRATAFITPRFVAARFLPIAAMFWLMMSRLAFFGAMYDLGLVPQIQTGG